ncbi:MAG: glycogen/starch synthase [Arcobacteraceae bacterium]|nr:glycogen/starch synthase [Arcobacteraceae bacterium]
MNILFASSEMFPYAKSGGLADVAQSLPEELRKIAKVYTIMPLYYIVDRTKHEIIPCDFSFDIWLNGVRHQIDLYKNSNNPYELFLYNPILCDREGLYHDSYGDFGDNHLRFGLFSYGVIETMLRLDLKINTIHINDWQTALIALLAKTKYYLSQKIVFTLHNIAYQGIFHKSVMNELELNWKECFKSDRFEYFDQINFLKAGIFYSDMVTTVSPTYANEIQTPYFAHTLENMLITNNYKLTGIINGISYDVFNPLTDEFIYKNYDKQTFELKAQNKTKLCKELNLNEPNRPLFVFIGRFTSQKGVDLILQSLHLLKDFEINVAILGSGEKYYNGIFSKLIDKYPNIAIKLGYDEPLARKFYASADFLLMPSVFEPCGLNQMIMMRYGGLPIVARTGGLRDTVVDFTDSHHHSKNQGIGITFDEHNMFWYMHAITKAISLYANQKKYIKFAKHNMSVDNSWKISAKEYMKVYK